jgi:hypothetical protein
LELSYHLMANISSGGNTEEFYHEQQDEWGSDLQTRTVGREVCGSMRIGNKPD